MDLTDNTRKAIKWTAQNLADVARIIGATLTQDEAEKLLTEILVSRLPAGKPAKKDTEK